MAQVAIRKVTKTKEDLPRKPALTKCFPMCNLLQGICHLTRRYSVLICTCSHVVKSTWYLYFRDQSTYDEQICKSGYPKGKFQRSTVLTSLIMVSIIDFDLQTTNHLAKRKAQAFRFKACAFFSS